ncbi:MAG: hypothetical protein E6483_13990, partial [Bacteroides stercoris]|nr:hypothetical protein [Bacteroides stercoris]
TFAFGLYKGHYTYPMVAQFSTGILAHFSISIYTIEHRTIEGSVTYLNDSIVIIRTRKKGLDNYETKIINLKRQ